MQQTFEHIGASVEGIIGIIEVMKLMNSARAGIAGEVVEILDALRRRGLRFVLVHNESSAAFMADAAARVTGTPGVVLATLGPGAASAVAGVARDTRAPRRRGEKPCESAVSVVVGGSRNAHRDTAHALRRETEQGKHRAAATSDRALGRRRIRLGGCTFRDPRRA